MLVICDYVCNLFYDSYVRCCSNTRSVCAMRQNCNDRCCNIVKYVCVCDVFIK